MNLTLELQSLDALNNLMEAAEALRIPAQDRMAERLSDIVVANFGDDGVDRPILWAQLRKRYADVFHHGDQTPREILTGALRASINVEVGNPDHSRVFTECAYAAEQQWGTDANGPFEVSIPPRPFFPLIGDQNNAVLTPYAEEQVRAAAEQAIAEALAG